MAELVGAVAMTHNPRIFWNAEGAGDDDRAAVAVAFAHARAAVERARPDAVIVLGNDHLDQFSCDDAPGFSVGLGRRCRGPFWYEDEIMSLPAYDAPVHAELAENLLHDAVQAGFEPARADAGRVDHAFTVPLSITLPAREVPVVPLITNTFVPPLPTSRRCFALGEVIRETIGHRPGGERIVLISSFNLSVDVGGPLMGRRATDFDQRVLRSIEAGDVDALVDSLPPATLVEHGNSTAEFLSYQMTLGVVGDRKPASVWYRLVDGWGGCPIVTWDLDLAPDTSTDPSGRKQP